MNGYNFTDRVRKVLQMAREEAARLHHEYVGTEHILLGLIREGEGVAAAVLTNLNVDLEEIQQKIEETVKKGKAAAAAGPDLPYTSRAKKVLELAMSEARELNHSYVGTEHLLLGLLLEGEGIAAHVLVDLGATLPKVRAEIDRLLVSIGAEAPPGPELPARTVGSRVLVHDAEPPYRLWEGRVTKVEGDLYEISVPGRASGELVKTQGTHIHPVPMRWTSDCPFCRAE